MRPGLYALERLADRLKKSGRTLLLCGARVQPERLLTQAQFVEQNILPHSRLRWNAPGNF